MYKKTNKIMASLIVLIMLFANISPVAQVIAYDGLNSQNSKTNNENVEFDAYFVEENNKSYEATKNIGEGNIVLATVSVKDAGYLKDARIEFVDSNFTVLDTISSEKVLSIKDNAISLNQVNSGENVVIEIPITLNHAEKINLNEFDKVSSVKFLAKYVDGKGKTHNINKTLNLNLKWTAEVQIEANTAITKYVPYDINNQKGVILQTVLTENLKDNILPVKSSTIEISVPEINGVYPVSATVNSKENMEYVYDSENNKLTIATNNVVNEENEVSWTDVKQRQYEITYTYPETAMTQEEVNVNLNGKITVETYSFDSKVVQLSFDDTLSLDGKVGEIVDINVESTEKIGKGFIEANFNREEKIETLFNEKVEVNISKPELVDEITLNMEKDNFLKGEKVSNGNSYYKTLKISKMEFTKFFGEEGNIDVYSKDTLIKTINNEIEDEVIVIELNSNDVVIKSSKPIKDGKFNLEFEKAVNKDIDYSLKQIEELDAIMTNTKLEIKNGETIMVDKTVKTKTDLVNTTLNAGLNVSNVNLSTVVPNENIELRAVLNTSSEYDKLYKDPQIVFTMPSYIEKIDVKNVQVLFDEELTLNNYTVEQNQIIVNLSGTQTNYAVGSNYGGANIVITLDLTTNSLTPNKAESMIMAIASQNENIEARLDLNFVAPSGVVAVNKISNFVDGQELMAFTQDESAIIEVQTSAKNATEEIQVINNYDNKIEKVEILGRTLSTDTTTTNNQAKLNNNLTAPMTSGISSDGVENVEVYYSNNGNATKDLNNSENGWTSAPEDLSQVKSYLIVLDEDTQINTGDSIKFTYDMQIPENLSYSMVASSLYTVYFDNVQEEQTINDQVTSRMVTVGTGIAPDLSVELSSNIEENSTVYNGEYILYTATIKNNSSVDAENTVLSVTAPTIGDGSLYKAKHVVYQEENFFTGYEELEDDLRLIEVGEIRAGQEKEIKFEIMIDKLANSSIYEEDDLEEDIDDEQEIIEEDEEIIQKELKMKVSVIADKMQREVESNEYALNVKSGDFKILVSRDATTDSVLTKDKILNYNVKIFSLSSENIQNAVAKIKIPEGLNIKNVNIEDLEISEDTIDATYEIDRENNIVIITFNNFLKHKTIECTVETEVGDVLGIISSNVELNANDKKYIGNVLYNEVDKLNFTIIQSSLDNSYVKEDENITFEYTVTNTSGVYTDDFTLESIIPEGLEIVGVETVEGDQSINVRSIEEDGKVKINRTFKGGQTIIFRITMKAKLLEEGTTQKQVTSYATIYGANFETKESNRVNATVEYNQNAYRGYEPLPEDVDNPDNPENPTSNKIISGIAFIDKNKDGQRNDDEDAFEGMEVRLYNKENNELYSTTYTTSNGEYIFTSLENGEYLVVFVFDKAKYDLTTYKNSEASNSTNSDAIEMDMEIDGEVRKVGITDTIKLTDSNARNIDIGLVEANKSILKLDKYISSITVSYGNVVKTYPYENAKLAKVEIPANELNNATVIVNYSIVITNEGAVSNYIKKVVDYVPAGMKFNSELNRDWYQSSNGDIYNSSLANIKLEPGQSKELTITLTKQMNSGNTGLVNNNAEIYEVYNEEGILDFDSTPANKVSGEEDMSSADIVIGIKTGDAVIYSILIATLICIVIAVSSYYIRRTILRRV